MKDFFKPEDFYILKMNTGSCDAIHVAAAANYKLNAEIEKWPVVYGFKRDTYLGFSEGKSSDDTYEGRLAFVRTIMKVTCLHEPTAFRFNDGRTGVSARCRLCEQYLVPRWESTE